MKDSYLRERSNKLIAAMIAHLLQDDISVAQEIARAIRIEVDPGSGEPVLHTSHFGPNAGWIDADERLPADGEGVLLYHCLGDSRRGDHAYDVATYRERMWIFPWDRGVQTLIVRSAYQIADAMLVERSRTSSSGG